MGHLEERAGRFALASWDSWIDFASDQWQTHLSEELKNWIERQEPRGGNNMRFAIEQSMRKFPDATDVWVMCDGDVNPFAAEGGNTDCLKDVPKPDSPSDEWWSASSMEYAQTSWQPSDSALRRPNSIS